jgi:hypothetical protein
LAFKGLKAKDIQTELTIVYGDEGLYISAVKKWRMHFLQARTELGDDFRSERRTNSGLTQVIAELIRECPFLSCKTLCKFLHEKLGLKNFHFR